MTPFDGNNRMKPIANVGDKVLVSSQGRRIFEVIGFSHEFQVDAENVFEEIYYDLQCDLTAEYILADQFEITVIGRTLDSPVEYIPRTRAVDIEEKPDVDGLLDELNDALALVELFGDHEDDAKEDRKLALKVCEIKAKLREASM